MSKKKRRSERKGGGSGETWGEDVPQRKEILRGKSQPTNGVVLKAMGSCVWGELRFPSRRQKELQAVFVDKKEKNNKVRGGKTQKGPSAENKRRRGAVRRQELINGKQKMIVLEKSGKLGKQGQ